MKRGSTRIVLKYFAQDYVIEYVTIIDIVIGWTLSNSQI